MNKTTGSEPADEMRSEYDFSGGERGRYAKKLRERGYTIRVYSEDGSYTDRHVLPDNVVILDADVRQYFPTSTEVNAALRSLIAARS